MILLTGANGFIGYSLINYLNKLNINNSIIIDINYSSKLDNSKYYMFTNSYKNLLPFYPIKAIVHLGAISNTLEKNINKIQKNNIDATKELFDLSQQYNIPFIFASTAAVYGNNGTPLNLYAESKLRCEEYINNRAVILRLFNVYGYDESHKGRMASTIYHWYHQLQTDKKIKLFYGSHWYSRDFIYIEDVCSVIDFFASNYRTGIYDIGTGISTSFEILADNLIEIMGYGSKEYIHMPKDLVSQYQKYTCANISNLKIAGYNKSFMSIKNGIESYIKNLVLATIHQ